MPECSADQSLVRQRQRQRTSDYATNTLGIEPSAIEVYPDKQTVTDTDRDGYRDLIEAVEVDEVERVIASEISRISRSVRNFAATVERIVDDNEVGLHILDIGLSVRRSQRT
jgi:DNA invertase Pin-like site-specific DNA recombinase